VARPRRPRRRAAVLQRVARLARTSRPHHHEDPAAIRLATVHWAVWLGGMLGVVLAVVLLLGWMQ
jgi:hypothetical protein